MINGLYRKDRAKCEEDRSGLQVSQESEILILPSQSSQSSLSLPRPTRSSKNLPTAAGFTLSSVFPLQAVTTDYPPIQDQIKSFN